MFFYEFDEMNLLLVLNFLCPEFEDCEIVFFFRVMFLPFLVLIWLLQVSSSYFDRAKVVRRRFPATVLFIDVA